jgi:hypothetical protein
VQGGELFAKISDGQYSLTEKKCCGFVKQIVRALNYIHERGIVHLDIKPQGPALGHQFELSFFLKIFHALLGTKRNTWQHFLYF